MKKTFFILLIFIIFAISLAIIFSLFLVQQKKLRYQDCVLLQDPQTKKVDCFGCANNICKDAPIEWVPYQKPEISIPYACFKSANGCQLAQ